MDVSRDAAGAVDAYPESGFKAYSVILGAWLALFPASGLLNSTGIFQDYLIKNDLIGYGESEIGWIFSTFASSSSLAGCRLVSCQCTQFYKAKAKLGSQGPCLINADFACCFLPVQLVWLLLLSARASAKVSAPIFLDPTRFGKLIDEQPITSLCFPLESWEVSPHPSYGPAASPLWATGSTRNEHLPQVSPPLLEHLVASSTRSCLMCSRIDLASHGHFGALR